MLRALRPARPAAAAAARRASSAAAAAAAAAADGVLPVGCLAFLGLGAMGYPMAGNLRRRRAPNVGGPPPSSSDVCASEVLVWNRTRAVAERHAREHGTRVLGDDFAQLAQANVVFMCMPTSDEVRATLERAAPRMQRGAVVVDCTSGHPNRSREMADWLLADHGVTFMDCAVSGGPQGAAKATVAAFVGCDSDDVVAAVVRDVGAFARNIVHLGPASAGHATKAINNVMNVSNMMVATEGTLALKKLGVDPAKALAVINSASGRSLMSMQRLPEEVLTGDFAYGFKLGLMRKDVRIANDILDAHFDSATMFRETLKLMDESLSDLDGVDFDSDYTEAVKVLEKKAGADLRSDTFIQYDPK